MPSREPLIRAMPDAETFRKHVDRLITPERADAESKVFIEMILTVANPEDDHSWHLANEAARHAFTKTEAFEAAFREYSGFPERTLMPAERYMVHAADAEM